jgi:hypothetical protein
MSYDKHFRFFCDTSRLPIYFMSTQNLVCHVKAEVKSIYILIVKGSNEIKKISNNSNYNGVVTKTYHSYSMKKRVRKSDEQSFSGL